MEQADRIKISRIIIALPDSNKQADALKAQVEASKVEIQKADTANASLYQPLQAPINGYQLEYSRLDGNTRVEVTEQKVQDGAAKKIGNVFYPIFEPTYTPLPAWGISWVTMFPCLMTSNVGKNNDQTYTPMPATGNEKDLINSFNSTVATLESYPAVERCTGQKWGTTAPITNQEVQDAMTSLKSTINSYKSLSLTQINDIYIIDGDPVKQAESIAAKNYLQNTLIPALDVWLAYDDFRLISPPPATESAFNSYNIVLLEPTKGNPAQLNVLKAAISARNSFVTTRKTQLNGYLGDVVQDFSSGAITTKSGLYGERGLFLTLRLHLLTGTLCKLVAMNTSANAQESIKASNATSAEAYTLVVKSSKFKIPSNGSKTIHVNESNLFNIGDNVYVCGDGQPEIVCGILAISGTRIDLDAVIPQKYTPANYSRIYKVLV